MDQFIYASQWEPGEAVKREGWEQDLAAY
jgi:hypothetical protein